MSNQRYYKYQPPLIYPPGDTLLELLEQHGMSRAELARQMGQSTKIINQLIKGHYLLTPEIAFQLELLFKMPAQMWLNLEQAYREYLAQKEGATTQLLMIDSLLPHTI